MAKSKTTAGKKKTQQKPVKKTAVNAPKKKAPAKAVSNAAKTSASRKETTVTKAAKNDTNQAAAPAAKKTKLTPKDLAYFKKKLETERARVLEEVGEIQNSNLKQSLTEQAGELSHYSFHLGDTASLSYDREFSMGLAERQQKYLEQIDEALARIADNTYGICKVTGEAISRERLEEVPVAKYSVKGKEILERQKRTTAGS